jgi:single-strand DNA-binding protein
MTFEIEGVLHKIYDTESKSSSFQTREFVITTEGTYPQFVKFQLTQDKCGIVDGYREGEKIKVFFDLRGREWQGKYFTNLNAWKLEKSTLAQSSFSDTSMPSEPPVFDSFDANDKNNFQADIDDLPF